MLTKSNLLVDINNFAFEIKVTSGLESTIPDGRPACRPAGQPEKLGIEIARAKLELGLGLSFEMNILDKLSVETIK